MENFNHGIRRSRKNVGITKWLKGGNGAKRNYAFDVVEQNVGITKPLKGGNGAKRNYAFDVVEQNASNNLDT